MGVRFVGSSDQFPRLNIEYFSGPVPCGFPSPALDHLASRLDLNELCIHRPASTYFVRQEGDSMRDAGIFDGSILVVDRSIRWAHRHIVIASINGEFTCKRLILRPVRQLIPENPAYAPINIPEGAEVTCLGVVTYAILPLLKL